MVIYSETSISWNCFGVSGEKASSIWLLCLVDIETADVYHGYKVMMYKVVCALPPNMDIRIPREIYSSDLTC